jgi:hypothetical protein
MQESLKGKAWKTQIKELIKSHHSKKDQLLVYCRLMGPNPTQTLPMWTAVCMAFQHSQEVGSKVMVLGQNASARDAAFCTVADAVALAKDLLAISPSSSISVLTADLYILPYCQVIDCHNNTMACKVICDSAAAILFMHPNTVLAIGWIPGKISFQPLEWLQTITIEVTAHVNPDLILAPPTPTAL